jgi:hypothetical protein
MALTREKADQANCHCNQMVISHPYGWVYGSDPVPPYVEKANVLCKLKAQLMDNRCVAEDPNSLDCPGEVGVREAVLTALALFGEGDGFNQGGSGA